MGMCLYAGYRNTRFAPDARRAAVWKAIAAFLERYIDPGAALVDLGSGYCDFVNAVRARRRWAVDLHLDPAEHAAEGVTPLRTDVCDLGALPEGEIDVAFASNILEHLDDARILRVCEEVLRRLRPGGRFIVLSPNYRHAYRTYFDDYTHVKVLTHVSLADLLASQGFEIERVFPRFLPFSMKGRGPRWGWLVALYLRSPWKPFAGQMLVVARKPG
jgi:SAM-dependent methyltransferase